MPLIWFSLAFAVGSLAADWVRQPAWVWLGLSVLFVILGGTAFLFQSRVPSEERRDTLVPWGLAGGILILGAFTLGAGRSQSMRPILTNPAHIAAYTDGDVSVSISGYIAAPPERHDARLQLKINVEYLRFYGESAHQPVTGKILVSVPADTDWAYGDHVLVTGYLLTPPEDEVFSYREYLARQDIYAYMPLGNATLLDGNQGNIILRALFSFRSRAIRTLYRLYPDPGASLLAAMLLGETGGLSESVTQSFREAGLAHLLAISGFHVALLAWVSSTVFTKAAGKRWGFALTVLFLLLYSLMVGGRASVVRAAMMGGLGGFAGQLDRRRSGFNLLAFTGALMIFIKPLWLGDPGFQLSFAATFALLAFLHPMIQATQTFLETYMRISTAKRIAGDVLVYVWVPLIAQIATLPLSLYYFQRFTLAGMLTNPLVVPVQPVLMLLGGVSMVVGMVWLGLGQVVAAPALVLIQYTLNITQWFTSLPIFTAPVQFSAWWVVGYYALIGGIVIIRKRKEGISKTRIRRLVWGGVATLLAVVAGWSYAANRPDGNLHLTLLDTNGGNAFLIQTPSGRNVLVNGGSSPVQLSDQVGRQLTFARRSFDYWIVGAPLDKAIGANLHVLDQFPPETVYWAGRLNASNAAVRLYEGLVDRAIPVQTAQDGDILDLGGGAVLSVVALTSRGAVMVLEYGDFRALLPLGMDEDALQTLEMGRTIGPVSVLLLAEEGLPMLNPEEWITTLAPQVVLLSIDPANRSGAPAPETLDALAPYSLLRTDQHGWIQLSTDGAQMWVAVESGVGE